MFLDEKDLLVTATKHSQTLQDAPAIASVITADEIRQMGARDLTDVLHRIPGMGIAKDVYGMKEIEVRGIKTPFSENVKLLIDGHSVNSNLNGTSGWTFNQVSVDSIKKIEIVRGPGSALYGSNAFSAVINIVTKDAGDIDGVVISGGVGSYASRKFNLQAGKVMGDLQAAFTFDYFKTDGARLKVSRDVLGNSGKTYDFEERISSGLKLAYKDWQFNSHYMSRQRGPYIGAAYALNDESKITVDQYFGDLSYRHAFTKDTNVLIKAYVDQFHGEMYWQLFPQGTTLPYYGTFAEGVFATPRGRERILGTELQFDTRLTEYNTLTAGMLFENRKPFNTSQSTNFNPNPAVCTSLPPTTFAYQDIGDRCNYIQNKTRDIWAAYVQDVWDINGALALTVGARHDHYSDFGDTTNPRAALVWKFLEKWDAKFLYGTAFRAPTTSELYFVNNPSMLGNSQLLPESVRTYEASVGYTDNPAYKARLSYFHNQFANKIQLVPQPSGVAIYQNTVGAEVQGLEAELRREFTRHSYLYANYTYQRPKDSGTGDRLADVPGHKGNLGGNYAITQKIGVNLNLFVSGERPRAVGDTRSAAPGYGLIDLTLISKNVVRDLDIRVSAHNLLGHKYADPAPAMIPGDFPREQRWLMLDALYRI